MSDPIPPNGNVAGPTTGSNGSWWPRVCERLYVEQEVWLHIENTAVGATGIVQEWCGDSVGDGTGTPYSSADGGWDPNGYIEAAKNAALKGVFDERWAFISFGQADANDDVSAANFQAALENVTGYLLAVGIKVALGFSSCNSQTTWYATKGSVGYAAALATYADNENVIAGADLYSLLGASYASITYDNSHLFMINYDRAGNSWYDALVDGGLAE